MKEAGKLADVKRINCFSCRRTLYHPNWPSDLWFAVCIIFTTCTPTPIELSAHQHSGKVRHTVQKGNVADLPSLTNVINCERAERQWEGKITAVAFFPLYASLLCLFVRKKSASVKDIYYNSGPAVGKNKHYSCREELTGSAICLVMTINCSHENNRAIYRTL